MVYVLPVGGQGADAALSALMRRKGELRHLVAQRLTLTFAPELRFMLDTTFDRLDDTRRMFSDERVRRDVDGTDGDDEGDG